MNANTDRLEELRIERNAAPAAPPNRRGLWIALFAIAGMAAVGLTGWASLQREKGFELHTATAGPIPSDGSSGLSVLDATGYVVARRTATVSAKVTGKVQEVLIEEGMRVDAGQVMATLDPIDADLARSLALSQYEAVRSQVGSNKAQLKEAEANVTRLGQLVGQQLVSRQQYDHTVAQRNSIRAELLVAQRNSQAAADSLRIADNSVDNTIVRAPFAGVVIAKSAQPGEIISPAAGGGSFTRTGIGTIVDMDSLEVQVDVSEAHIGKVQPKMPVETTLNAYPDWKIPAEVIAIIPTADRGKATIRVRIALKERDGRIVPDMGARVSFLDSPKSAATVVAAKPIGVLVPKDAVVQRLVDGRDTTVVFMVKEGKATMTPVREGGMRGAQRVISSGLGVGDAIVSMPPAQLQDGDTVTRKTTE